MPLPLRNQVLKVQQFWEIFQGLRLRIHSVQEREGIVFVLGEFLEEIDPDSSGREVYRAVSRFLRKNREHLKGFDPCEDARAFHASISSYLRRKQERLTKSL